MLYYLFGWIFFLVSIVYLLFFMVSYSMSMDTETISAYECGFDSISETRIMFSYRFFLIAILFLIFDVEIVLMLPIPFLIGNISGMKIFYLFVIILIAGLLYEYYCGSLEWLM